MNNRNNTHTTLDFQRIQDMLQSLRGMSSEEKKEFYSGKFFYYQFFTKLALLISCLASVLFLYSDYQLNNGDIWPTLIPRLSIFGFAAVYLFLEPKIRDYRKGILLNYALLHSIIWCTIWSCYHLIDNSHFADGSFSFNLIMLATGFGGGMGSIVLNYVVFIGEIIVSNTFNHYPTFDIILSLNIPTALGVIMSEAFFLLNYYDQNQTEKKLQIALVTDPLTQVLNRQKLEVMTEENIISGTRLPVSVVMLDIDHFKEINDTYGHRTGDQVLRYLGKVLKEGTRKEDMVIRYGGEEFMILMQECSPLQAQSRIELLRKQVENAPDAPVKFTLSGGISSYEGDFNLAEEQSDEALYLSKQNGRNRVTVHPAVFGKAISSKEVGTEA